MGAGFPGLHPSCGGSANQAGRCRSLLQVDQTQLVGAAIRVGPPAVVG